MASSKFSVSRATKSTLYSISSFQKSSSNLSQLFDRSHKGDSNSAASSSSDGLDRSEPSTPEPARHRRKEEELGHRDAEKEEEDQDEQVMLEDGEGEGEEEYTTSRPGSQARGVASREHAATAVSSPVDGVVNKSPPRAQRLLRQHGSNNITQRAKKGSMEDEPVPLPRPTPRKSKTWAGRLSTILPSLMTQHTDQPTSLSSAHINRKPLPTGVASSTDALPMENSHPSHPRPHSSIRPVATFDLGFGPSSAADLTLTDPSRPASPAHPPPIPPKFDGPSPDPNTASSSATQPPTPPPKLLTKNAPPLPPREPPQLPQSATEPGASAGRLRKEKRQTPPSIPPPISSVEGLTLSVPDEDASRNSQRNGADSRRRSNSFQQVRKSSYGMLGIQPRATSPIPDARGRSTSAQPAGGANGRVVSTPVATNSQSPSREDKRGRLRRSWLPGGRSRSNSQDLSSGQYAKAWVLGQDAAVDYKTSFLLSGEKVPELWNESGAVLVYLFPRDSGCGPSFKVPIYAVSSSEVFNDLIQAEASPTTTKNFSGRSSLTIDDAFRQSPPDSPPLDGSDDAADEMRLYLPGSSSPPQNGQPATAGQPPQEVQEVRADFERLMAFRNLFAFLTGQPLVATKGNPTVFAAFIQISRLLQEFNFTNQDGSTSGEAVDMSFGFFTGQLGLSDVRHSREKSLEALILGERMRSMDLFNEAFAHVVGKYTAIIDLKSPLFGEVSPQTRQKLERANLDLVNRQHNVNGRLEQFDFPSLFSGIANSTSIDEVKSVRFGKWRTSFGKMRQFVLSYYKSTFGNWPPKASSKKNPFSESGLNRLVLKALYSDMCALYDLLVDRESLTPRVVNGGLDDESSPDTAMISALRKVLAEFDASTPPVLPPIPFDVPMIPSMRAVLETYDKMSAKDRAKFDKRIKEHELILVLHKAYNYDTNKLKIPFLSAFKDFEHHEARGKNAADLADQRIGYWLFLYVVIQSLPMLTIDAPGLQHTEGVEYFLCEPPMGNPPWLEDSRQVRKMWYEVSGGQGYVELSADSVMFSVEAIYHRSHCWAAAKKWEGIQQGDEVPGPEEPALSPLAPPPSFLEQDGGGPMQSPPPLSGSIGSGPSPVSPTPPTGSPKVVGRPRTNSPGSGRALAARNSAYRSSIAIGLEPVPIGDLPGSPSHDRVSRNFTAGSPMSPADSRRLNLPRSRSANNLIAQAEAQGVAHSQGLPPLQQQQGPGSGFGDSEPATSTMTFDDILGGAEQKKDKKKKMGKFF